MSLAKTILTAIDPTLELDSYTDLELEQEAAAIALHAIEQMKGTVEEVDSDRFLRLTPRQRMQYANQMALVAEHGKWRQAKNGEGAGYVGEAENPLLDRGVICASCTHYAGDRACEIVEGDISPMGFCRMWIIPDGELVRTDALRTDGQIFQWQGLKIGVTHQPGDMRFSWGVPMRSKYGTIHRTWGKAADGKSIDVYLPANFDPQQDYPMWRISQKNPESGMLEEWKYGIYPTAEEFLSDYIYHAGHSRVGHVEPVNKAEMDVYRADGIYHADNCGCEACAAKAQVARSPKRKRKAKPPVEEKEEPEQVSSYTQDAEDPDLSDLLVEEFLERSRPVFSKMIRATQRWAMDFDSLEVMQEKLKEDPRSLFDRIPLKPLEDFLFQRMMLADLAGRDEVLDETRIDSLSDSLLRYDAPRKPSWLNLAFKDAIAYFKSKLNIPVASYKDMEEGYHSWAFSIANMTRADLLDAARFIIDQGLSEGKSYDDQMKMWNRLIKRQGWEPGKGQRVYTIIDTNTRSAIGTGRGKQIMEVKDKLPIIIWRWRDSPNPRLNHQALHNKGIPASNPFWKKARTPGGFGCRCGLFSATRDYCDRNNIEILENPPEPETIMDKGFMYPLDGISSEERDRQINEMESRLSPEMQKILEEERSKR